MTYASTPSRKTTAYIKVLTDSEREVLRGAVEDIEYPESNYAPYMRKIQLARQQVRHIFRDIIERKDFSRSAPHASGVIKILNLPVDRSVAKPPVGGAGLKRIEKRKYLSENVLVMLSSFFGQPYSMYCEGTGLVNNLVPTQQTSGELTGLGAHSDLRFHIENAALRFLTGYDCAPKALFLTGVTQEPNPPHTRVSDARAAFAMLSPQDREALMKPQYQIRLPYRWRQFQEGYADLVTRRVPLVQSTPEGLVVNATLYGDMISCFGSTAGERAAKNFEAALEEIALNEIAAPGEMLCIDNLAVLHARTPFKASFDENGRASRWVQRIFVTESLDRFRGWQAKDHGVFAPTFRAERLREAA
jgi:hypothetical protein